MPTEVIIRELISEKNINKTELKLVILCFAVLKACKQSNMISLNDKELYELNVLMDKSVLSSKILYKSKGRNLVLIYRKRELENHLNSVEIMNFLRSLGYKGNSLIEFLEELKLRINIRKINGETFPHEIGIFLGYPLCDIVGFLENSGRDYLYSGYWKVYSNLEETLKKFNEMDKAKTVAINEWFAGRNFNEIAC